MWRTGLFLTTFGVASLAVVAQSPAAQPVVIAQGAVATSPREPQVAVDSAGKIHLAYGAGNDIFYAVSTDLGSSFAEPVKLPSAGVIALGMRRGPRIAVCQKSICITVIGGAEGKGRDGDVLAFVSTDAGKTWQGPSKVNDEAGSAREGLHALAGFSSDKANLLACTWLDLRHKRTEIFAATSTDGGLTWKKNKRVYQSPDKSVCECCHPSLAFDPSGKSLQIMWRNSLSGNRDMYASFSKDFGETFSPAVKLGESSWKLDACPMDGGAIAAISPTKWAAVWRTDKTIFLGAAGIEKKLGSGQQPWIALFLGRSQVVWLEERTGRLLYWAEGLKQPLELASKALDPVIAAGPNGQGPLVVAWETRDGGQGTIYCQVVAGSTPLK